MILLIKLLLYYKNRVSQFFGRKKRASFSYFMKFQFIIRQNFFTAIFDAFQIMRECSSGFIRLFYQIIDIDFIFLPLNLYNTSQISLNVTSEEVISTYNDSISLLHRDRNKYLYPPTISAPLRLMQTLLNFRIGQSGPTPIP